MRNDRQVHEEQQGLLESSVVSVVPNVPDVPNVPNLPNLPNLPNVPNVTYMSNTHACLSNVSDRKSLRLQTL